MNCKHYDCFTCPYDDCIEDSVVQRLRKKTTEQQKSKQKKSRKAYFHDYYLAHREQMIENTKRNQAKKKGEKNV